jgi:predicted porin
MGASRQYERFEGVDFHKNGARIFAETEWLEWLSLSGHLYAGDEVNYYPSANVAPFLARSREAEVGVTFRPVPALRIENTYIHSRLTAPDTRPGLWSQGDPIFKLHLIRSKANYQFTRELSLRTIVDYNVLLPNGHLVDLEKDKRFTLDLLATYLLNPGTALYVGVTDAYANLRLDPRLSPAWQRTDRATTSTGRQFFIKMSYLLRY